MLNSAGRRIVNSASDTVVVSRKKTSVCISKSSDNRVFVLAVTRLLLIVSATRQTRRKFKLIHIPGLKTQGIEEQQLQSEVVPEKVAALASSNATTMNQEPRNDAVGPDANASKKTRKRKFCPMCLTR